MALLVSKWAEYRVHLPVQLPMVANTTPVVFYTFSLQLAFIYKSLVCSFLNKFHISHFLAKITE